MHDSFYKDYGNYWKECDINVDEFFKEFKDTVEQISWQEFDPPNEFLKAWVDICNFK